MNRLTRFLETRYSGFVCILIAVTCRIVNVMFSSYAGGDKYSLAVQSKNLLEGKGLSITKYFVLQTSQPIYDYTPLWPPGYPLLLAPFLKVFNYDIYWASTFLDIITSVAFIFIVRKICRQIGFPAIAVNLMTLVAGCFEYPFITDSLPTDTISFLFFLVGISFCLKIVTHEKYSFSEIFFTGFFLFLACFFRYAYFPLSGTVPLIIIFYAWRLKNKLLFKKGLLTTGVVIVLVTILLIILKTITGQATYLTPTERGVFPENIVHWYPVVPASFIDLPFFTSQVIKNTSIQLKTQLQILEIINIVAVFFLLSLIYYFLFIKKVWNNMTAFKWLTLWFTFCSILLLLTIGYLSVTYETQRGFINNWTYVYEPRYYALLTLFIQLLFFSWIFLFPSFKKDLWQKIIIVACSFLLFIEVSHSVYFYSKVMSNYNNYKSSVFREQDYNYFKKLLPKLEIQYPGRDILVASPNDKCYLYMAAYYGQKGIFDGVKLKNSVIKAKPESVLIIMLFDEELSEYQTFLSVNRPLLIQHINNSNFFLFDGLPQ